MSMKNKFTTSEAVAIQLLLKYAVLKLLLLLLLFLEHVIAIFF